MSFDEPPRDPSAILASAKRPRGPKVVHGIGIIDGKSWYDDRFGSVETEWGYRIGGGPRIVVYKQKGSFRQ